MALTADRLREVLDYDPLTGAFTWKAPQHGVTVGSRAGSIGAHGYRNITVNQGRYRASRLAWLYVHGAWPSGLIDHIDRDRQNDRIANLREATRSQNNGNAARRSDNTSGYKGVGFHAASGLWYAKIGVRGRVISLGYHRAKEAAARAYDRAAREHFGEFASLNFAADV